MGLIDFGSFSLLLYQFVMNDLYRCDNHAIKIEQPILAPTIVHQFDRFKQILKMTRNACSSQNKQKLQNLFDVR
jgi:hypothetical protein